MLSLVIVGFIAQVVKSIHLQLNLKHNSGKSERFTWSVHLICIGVFIWHVMFLFLFNTNTHITAQCISSSRLFIFSFQICTTRGNICQASVFYWHFVYICGWVHLARHFPRKYKEGMELWHPKESTEFLHLHVFLYSLANRFSVVLWIISLRGGENSFLFSWWL